MVTMNSFKEVVFSKIVLMWELKKVPDVEEISLLIIKVVSIFFISIHIPSISLEFVPFGHCS